MSLSKCLEEAVKGKEVTEQEALYLNNRYEGYRKAHEVNGPDGAAEQARLDLLESLAAETKEKRRRAKISMRHIMNFEKDIASHGENIGDAILYKLEHNGEATYSSVAGREKAIVGMANGRMENLLNEFRRGAIGGDMDRHNKARLSNVVREAFGVDTKDPKAKQLAKAWMETAEWQRQRFNNAGGAIGKLENWGMAQHHDRLALLKRGHENWKNDIKPMLDVDKMKHPLTGKAINNYELDAVLDDVWQSIVTEGWNKREPARQAFGSGALASRRADNRFLIFKNPDQWLNYQKNYGGGADPFAAMMGHINGMAKDIAELEIMGPNPAGTMEWAKQRIMKEAQKYASGKKARWSGDKTKAVSKANGRIDRIENVWASINGEMNTPVNATWANVLGGMRSIITASVLGSAAISAISDLGTNQITRRFNGIGGDAVSSTLAMFKGANKRDAVEAGLILDSANHVFQQQARYAGTLSGPAWTSFIADRVLTWSGLTPWTQAGRHAFGMAFQNEVAKRVGLKYADLPKPLRKAFARYGIDAKAWEVMRKHKVHDKEGARLLRPNDIAARGDEKLGEKYLEMILSETEYAIPSGTHRSRTLGVGATKPGTFLGEVVRSGTMFKSFGIVFMMMHTKRAMHEGGKNGVARGVAYAGSLLISTTMLGGLAMQLKQIAAGRDPRNMDNAGFWGGALLQGGGLGIYGDFLFADLNRYGGNFAQTAMGPLVERTNDLWNLTAGNVAQYAKGEKTHFGRELVKFASGNIPGSNIWYFKTAWERNVLDQVQKAVDPQADKAFKSKMKYWKRQMGQEYFWKPGDKLPSRLPSF